MPREIDVDKRLAEIAAATLAVARDQGASAVTIRSVAKQLGGSTTLVTNYLPTRSALILNALDRGRARWTDELAAVQPATPANLGLAAAIEWALSADDDDPVLRIMMYEVIANRLATPDLAEWLATDSREMYEMFAEAARASGVAEETAEAVFLVVLGAYNALTENPGDWDAERARVAAYRVAGLDPSVRPELG